MAADPAPYVFAPHERPMFPGSPANPEHPNIRRHAYFLIGCLIGMTAGLGSALVTVNLNFAQGTLGLDSDESAWLTAAYLMPNVTANLLLVKYRQQFGLQPFIRYTLAAFAATSVLHLFVHDFWTAVVVRAMSGLAGAGLFSLTLYYILQSKPAPKRIAAVMIAICVPQFGIPLARAISPHLLMTGDWHMLYWFELAFVLATLAAVMTLPLPPSEREKVFEPLDFLTFSLLAPGLCLLVAAFSLGRVEWWLERDWIGYALAGSAALIAAAVLVEHHRANPLINTRWLGQREMVRLIAVAASVRILLSEQSFGSVGFLGTVGMTNDQMITLNLIILAASLAGLTFAVKTFRPQSVGVPIVGASMLIAIGAFMDAGANNLSRPEDFYLSLGNHRLRVDHLSGRGDGDWHRPHLAGRGRIADRVRRAVQPQPESGRAGGDQPAGHVPDGAAEFPFARAGATDHADRPAGCRQYRRRGQIGFGCYWRHRTARGRRGDPAGPAGRAGGKHSGL